jgi:hypothetical protein
MRSAMARAPELKLKMTDAAISAAIRYLDPELRETTDETRGAALVICASLVILVIGWLGLLWLCCRIP